MSTFLFNFRAEFVELVRTGQKRRTVRRNRADNRRPVPGDTAKCFAGLRTRATELLVAAPVVSCQGVRLDLDDGLLVVDGHRLSMVERADFARRDGFRTYLEMRLWFETQYGCGETVEGFVVAWDWERRA